MKITLFFLAYLISASTFGQKSVTEKQAYKNTKCKYSNLYTVEERYSFYPFSKALKVVLISFDNPDKLVNNLPVSNQLIDSTQVKEIKVLSKENLDQLTDILYNYCYYNDKFPKIIREAKCYNPRNAILFLDENSKVFEFIEICFSCNRVELGTEKIKTWDNCTEKNEMIMKFFLSMNIKLVASQQD